MTHLFQTIGLAVAGIDPLGAILLFSMVHDRVSKAKISVFTITVLLSSIIAGVVITQFSEQLLAWIASSTSLGSTTTTTDAIVSPIWGYVEIAVAIVLAGWVVHSRYKHKDETTQKENKSHSKSWFHSSGIWMFMVMGVGFTVTALTDPTFLATISIAMTTHNLSLNILLFTLWTLISQIMLFALFCAYLLGLDKQLVAKATPIWQNYKPLVYNFLFVVGLIIAGLLFIDACYFLTHGYYYGDPAI